LRKAVDAAESQIAETFKDRPLAEAAIRQTLGESYSYLGEPALAIQQLERALVLRRQTLGLNTRTLSKAWMTWRQRIWKPGRSTRPCGSPKKH
jgi:hypothetical protein